LHNHTLTCDTSLGVSNEVATGYEQATISFTDGLLLVIQTNDAD
jgi:thiamine pyrophosphokinase